jgi:hypothetical protein
VRTSDDIDCCYSFQYGKPKGSLVIPSSLLSFDLVKKEHMSRGCTRWWPMVPPPMLKLVFV